MAANEKQRIALWSGPRNISTALMYSFAQRPDTRVFDEPLYAHYLTRTPAYTYHPGADEIVASQENDGQRIVRDLFLGEHDRPVVFFKNMTHHLEELDMFFTLHLTNIMLTRNPNDMLLSYTKKITRPTVTDTGYDAQVNLLNYLKSHGQHPIVLDSSMVLAHPEGMMKRLCRKLRLEFDPHMLTWEAGPRPEDGGWAKYWYHNVHHSSGLTRFKREERTLPKALQPLLNDCDRYYKQLLPYTLSA